MNRWIGIGRLASDVEVRYTKSGSAVASYRMAVNRQFKQDGQPDADFLNCVTWGKNAEFASKYLTKGMRIAVEGRIQTGSYQKEDGSKVYTTDIVVEHHEFCESKGSGQTAEQKAKMDDLYTNHGSFVELDDGDELPF